jgi:hypothetical protein
MGSHGDYFVLGLEDGEFFSVEMEKEEKVVSP